MRALQEDASVTQAQLKTTMEAIHKAEQRVTHLEFFIVLVYVLEMAHIFGEMTHSAHAYSLIPAVSALVAALSLVILLVTEWPKSLYNRAGSTDEIRCRRWLITAVVLLGA